MNVMVKVLSSLFGLVVITCLPCDNRLLFEITSLFGAGVIRADKDDESVSDMPHVV